MYDRAHIVNQCSYLLLFQIGSGEVDFDEFVKIMLKYWKDPVDEEKELKDAFKVFDRNNDGYVVADEIKYVMKNLGHDLSDKDIDEIMKKADVNGDGRLDYEGKVLNKALNQTFNIIRLSANKFHKFFRLEI